MELGLIALIAIIFFGPRRLPELGKGLGKSIKEFKGAFRELHSTRDEVVDELKDVHEALKK
jgi:sec-independent protein translocase protein TatA